MNPREKAPVEVLAQGPREGEYYCACCGESRPNVGVCPGCKGIFCPEHYQQPDHRCEVDLGIGN